MSRPVWGAWIEIGNEDNPDAVKKSRPVWGAWIEICSDTRPPAAAAVAPRMGRVD